MTERTYPFKGWVLKPSFKPAEIEILSPYRSVGTTYLQAANGRIFNEADVHASKADAIAHGRQAIARIEADLATRTANLTKKRAALDKAEAA